MDQFAQTNDLQQAIDSIANGGAAANNDVSQFWIPPMPPMPENGDTMPEVKPLVPVEDVAPAATAETAGPSAEQILSQGMGTEAMPPAVETPAGAAPTVETAPVAETAPAGEAAPATEVAPAEDLSDVKQNILKDCLMEKWNSLIIW